MHAKRHMVRKSSRRPAAARRRTPTIERLFRRYEHVWNWFRWSHPERHEALRSSASVETDPLVVAMLRDVGGGGDLRTAQCDALQLVRYTWGLVAAHSASGVHVPTPAAVMHRLRDAPAADMKGVLRELASLKLAYEDTLATTADNVCQYLPCTQPADVGVRLNSRGYCRRHIAAGILNGMRHVCEACHLVSLLCLKGDPTVGGHLHNSAVTLVVPLHDAAAGGGGLNIRVRRHCAGTVRRWDGAPLRLVDGPATYLAPDGRPRAVPPNSWVHYNRNGLVDAWLHIEYRDLRTGVYRPVVTRERRDHLLTALGWDDEWGNPLFGFCRERAPSDATR